ncbi:ATP-binding cassette domain-containing protein [Kitasatospora azatica]|uniref:ATP-binding cassette domain-containing protein n=1 Tax=Kitasatospora azatica TaxID=58347 RepID=UPI000691E7A9|nr:ATP-binding cassette domain-containing protein [Kitasatospora azatica]
MIQASGLTKVYRRGHRPALLDLGFDVGPGSITALLGPADAGKTTALRLMLELERGEGAALFDGRTYRRLRRPEHEVGVLLPSEQRRIGNPGRTARGQLRMLAAAVGVPSRRADELLEQTRLATVADHRLRSFSPGMTRRLALAAALLGDPSTLLLDAPTDGLSPRNAEWLHAFIQAFPAGGGSVLVTTRSPQEAALLADRVLTLDGGQLVADQSVSEFRRTRLRPEVAVRGPQMARLADLLLAHGAQVRQDDGAGIAVSGLGRTEIGEFAYRNGILLHELADRLVEQPAPRAPRPSGVRAGAAPAVQVRRVSPITVGERLRPPTASVAAPAGVAPEAPPTVRLARVTAPATSDTSARVPAGASVPAPVSAAALNEAQNALDAVGAQNALTAHDALNDAPDHAPLSTPVSVSAEFTPQPLTGPDHWNG